MAAERQAEFAGRFYPGEREQCEEMLEGLLGDVRKKTGLAAIVPHAGWVYSGSTAALGIAAVMGGEPDTVIIFGSVHVLTRNKASLYAEGVWRTPLGNVAVDEELAERIAAGQDVEVDPGVHQHEHSIEVELPFLQRLLPKARIVPIMVRPGPWAEDVGRSCARAAREMGRRVVYVGSTDLTHYGPSFGFEPQGRGEEGIRWAREVNDRRFIELIEKLDAGGVITEAAENRNACGAGAVAATIGAALEMGANRYEELRHTTSAELEYAQGGRPLNSVGYEAGVFIRSE